MMREVLTRRFAKLMKDGPGAAAPDLVLIDGGRGHLAAAQAVFADLGVEGVALAAVAKARMASPGGARADRSMSAEAEQLFLPDRETPILPQPKSPALYFLQRLRGRSPSLRHRLPPGAPQKGDRRQSAG